MLRDIVQMVIVLAIALALFIIWRRSRHQRHAVMPVFISNEPITSELPQVVAQMPHTLPETGAAGAIGANPDEAARVLRGWLAEPRRS